jgi:homoserine O-succinyltransferase
MTIILPESYHIRHALVQSRVVCISPEEALRQDIRPLRVGILNVMPKAETYEYSLLHPLGRSVLQIQPLWLKLESHRYQSSDRAHIVRSYVSFAEAIRAAPLDGLILTGAPVETLPYEKVNYWQELREILDYARSHVVSTLGICWGGLALGEMLGLPKHTTEQKIFGVFATRNLERNHRITGDTDDVFWVPQSRHASIADEVLERASEEGRVRLLAYAPETGYTIFESADHRFFAHLGHPEYEPERLVFEYARDVKDGRRDVLAPANVDLHHPVNMWRSHRNELFSQWIKYLYDSTSL